MKLHLVRDTRHTPEEYQVWVSPDEVNTADLRIVRAAFPIATGHTPTEAIRRASIELHFAPCPAEAITLP